MSDNKQAILDAAGEIMRELPEGAHHSSIGYYANGNFFSVNINTSEGAGWSESGMGKTPVEAWERAVEKFTARLALVRAGHVHEWGKLRYDRDTGQPWVWCYICGADLYGEDVRAMVDGTGKPPSAQMSEASMRVPQDAS